MTTEEDKGLSTHLRKAKRESTCLKSQCRGSIDRRIPRTTNQQPRLTGEFQVWETCFKITQSRLEHSWDTRGRHPLVSTPAHTGTCIHTRQLQVSKGKENKEYRWNRFKGQFSSDSGAMNIKKRKITTWYNQKTDKHSKRQRIKGIILTINMECHEWAKKLTCCTNSKGTGVAWVKASRRMPCTGSSTTKQPMSNHLEEKRKPHTVYMFNKMRADGGSTLFTRQIKWEWRYKMAKQVPSHCSD